MSTITIILCNKTKKDFVKQKQKKNIYIQKQTEKKKKKHKQQNEIKKKTNRENFIHAYIDLNYSFFDFLC